MGHWFLPKSGCGRCLAPQLLIALLVAPGVAAAQLPCEAGSGCTPAQPVPKERWGQLEPRAIVGDDTAYTFHGEPNCGRYPLWFDVDVEAGVLFTATGNTIDIYRLDDPANPVKTGSRCRPVLTPQFPKSDEDYYYRHLDAPPGVSDLLAVGGAAGIGFVVLDTSQIIPPVKYQDEKTTIFSIHATTMGDTHYGFAATSSRSVLVYDMSKAESLTTGCLEATQDNHTHCGVFVARMPFLSRNLSGTGEYIMIDNGQVWHVRDPLNPQLVTTLPQPVFGFALWRQDESYFAGLLTGHSLEIYSIPCIPGGGCAPQLLSSSPTPGPSVVSPTTTLSVSNDDGVVYLYVGSGDTVAGTPQREYLFDATKPAKPLEITPKLHPDGYWGWYYQGNLTGFRNLAPLGGVVRNQHFYRVAFSILDVHARVVTLLFSDGLESGSTSAWSRTVGAQ